VAFDDFPASDPDCPSCGTRCQPTRAGWTCRTCGIDVLGVGDGLDD
jgi:ribosomal protein L37AE/L43A